MVDLSFSLAEIISILGLVLTFCVALGSLLLNMWRKVVKNAEDLSTFKLEVATSYVTSKQVVSIEQKLVASEARLVNTLENLTSRIDRLLDRYDTDQRNRKR